MVRRILSALSLSSLLACTAPSPPPERRAELAVVGPASVKIVPAAGQLPYCLAFTASERGVVRQLTMTQDHKSVACAAGAPIGGLTYRIPPGEGKVRIYVLFSDRALGADAIAAQIHEATTGGKALTAMDLRASGQLRVETLEFTPSAAAPPAGSTPP